MNKLFLTLLLAGAVTVGRAQAVAQGPAPANYSFTLADCINYAYQHQDTVVNAGLDIKSAEYRIKEIKGQGLPQINGSASFQDYLKSPTTIFPDFITPSIYGVLVQEKVKDGNGNPIVAPVPTGGIPVSFNQKYTSNLGATLNQIIFDGSFFIGLQASKTYRDLSVKNYTRSKIEANISVTKAYYQVLVSNERIKLLEANIKQIKQQLDQTAAQNKQGFVEKIDVDRITVQYNDLITNHDNTIRLLALNYQLLKFQMGMPVNDNLTLLDKLEDIKFEESLPISANDTSFVEKRIEYGLVETQIQLNKYDVKQKQARYYPTLSFIGNSSILYQNNDFSKLFRTSYPSTYIGLNLNVPIFTGFQHLNQVKQSKIALQKSQNDLVNLKNGLTLQANSSRITYINGLQTLNNQKRNREVAEEVLRVSRIKYQQGVGSSIEVTQAESALASANDTYIQGLYQALISKVDLDRAYGRIQ